MKRGIILMLVMSFSMLGIGYLEAAKEEVDATGNNSRKIKMTVKDTNAGMSVKFTNDASDFDFKTVSEGSETPYSDLFKMSVTNNESTAQEIHVNIITGEAKKKSSGGAEISKDKIKTTYRLMNNSNAETKSVTDDIDHAGATYPLSPGTSNKVGASTTETWTVQAKVKSENGAVEKKSSTTNTQEIEQEVKATFYVVK